MKECQGEWLVDFGSQVSGKASGCILANMCSLFNFSKAIARQLELILLFHGRIQILMELEKLDVEPGLACVLCKLWYPRAARGAGVWLKLIRKKFCSWTEWCVARGRGRLGVS